MTSAFSVSALFLLCSSAFAQTYQEINSELYLPSTQYNCMTNDSGSYCPDRVWIFPEIHISLVCKADFRPFPVGEDPQYMWPEATSEEIQDTWGPFLHYLAADLVPQIGLHNEDPTQQTGLFWMQGGEGRPG